MEIKPIRTEDDYRAVLREVSALVDLDPAPETPQGERLDVLSTLVEAYERKHHAIDLPDPVEAVVRGAYGAEVGNVFVWMAVIVAVGLVAVCFIKGTSLRSSVDLERVQEIF